jgi:hypothetical protein
VKDLMAYLGTISIAALLYCEVRPAWIVASFAMMVAVLMACAWFLVQRVFLQQGGLLALAAVARGLAYNVFSASNFPSSGWHGNFAALLLTAAILVGMLPLAFRLRNRYAGSGRSWLDRCFALDRPEQLLFFAPVVLVTCTIAVKISPGTVTLLWGVEGVLVILLGLLAGQRTYRITGLALLLLCVSKIILHDAWQLNERDRYITFIALGAALTIVSSLYSKFRESIRKLL